MDDAKWLFQQYSRDTKSIARSASHRICGSKSTKCTLPSDGLSKRELKKMSGEVITYNTHKPMCFKEFKKMPTDLQSDYLTYLINEKRAQCKDIADMLQITPSTLSHVFKTLRVDKSRATGRTDEDKAIWRAFLNGETPEVVEPEEATEVETIVEENEKPMTVESVKNVTPVGLRIASTRICFEGVTKESVKDIATYLSLIISEPCKVTVTVGEE